MKAFTNKLRDGRSGVNAWTDDCDRCRIRLRQHDVHRGRDAGRRWSHSFHGALAGVRRKRGDIAVYPNRIGSRRRPVYNSDHLVAHLLAEDYTGRDGSYWSWGRHMKSLLLIVVGAVAGPMALLSGCSAEVQPRFTVADSAGVRVATNRALPVPEWRLDTVPSVSIGSEDSPEHTLYKVYSARSFSDGRIVIAMALSEIRIFDPEGNHLISIGREGDGPGEFRFLWDVHPLDDERIRAFDIGRRRTMVFDANSGALLSETPLQARFDTPNGAAPLYGDRYSGVLTNAGYSKAFVTVASNGGDQAADTLGTLDGADDIDLVASPRPRLLPLYSSTSAGVRVWAGWWGEYEVKRWDEGDLELIVRFELPPVSIDDQLREHLGPDAKPVLDRVPYWNKLLATADGWLWVRRYRNPVQSDPWNTWDVFNPRGRRVAMIRTPSDAVIKEVHDDHVLGVFRDEWDIEIVQRRRILRR